MTFGLRIVSICMAAVAIMASMGTSIANAEQTIIDSIASEFPIADSAIDDTNSEINDATSEASVVGSFDGGSVVSVDREWLDPASDASVTRGRLAEAVWSGSWASGAMVWDFGGGERFALELVSRSVPDSLVRDGHAVFAENVQSGVDSLQVISDSRAEEFLVVRGDAAGEAQVFVWRVTEMPANWSLSYSNGLLAVTDSHGWGILDIRAPIIEDSAGNQFEPDITWDPESKDLAVSFNPVLAGAVGDWVLDPIAILTASYESGDFQVRWSNNYDDYAALNDGLPAGWTASTGGTNVTGDFTSGATVSNGLYVRTVNGPTIENGNWVRIKFTAPTNTKARRITYTGTFSDNVTNRFRTRAELSTGWNSSWTTASSDMSMTADQGGTAVATWAGIYLENDGGVSTSGNASTKSPDPCTPCGDHATVTLVDQNRPTINTPGSIDNAGDPLDFDSTKWYGPDSFFHVATNATHDGSGVKYLTARVGAHVLDTKAYVCNFRDEYIPCPVDPTVGTIDFRDEDTSSFTEGNNNLSWQSESYGGWLPLISGSNWSGNLVFKFDSTAPAVPVSWTPSPSDGATGVGAANGKITLTWPKFTDTNGSGVDHYEVCVTTTTQSGGKCATGWQYAPALPGDISTFDLQTYVATTLYWKVRAVDAADNTSADSATQDVTLDVLAPVVSLSGPADNLSKRSSGSEAFSGTVTEATGVDHVEVQYRAFGTTTWTQLGSNASVSGTTPNFTYSLSCDLPCGGSPADGNYEVRAVAFDSASGTPNSQATAPRNVCRDTTLTTQPANVYHEFVGSDAKVWWTSVGGAAGYIIERKPTGGAYAVVSRVPSGVTSIAQNGIGGSGFQWRVQSIGLSCTTSAKASTGTESAGSSSGPGAGTVTSYPQIGAEAFWTQVAEATGPSSAAQVNIASGNLNVGQSLASNAGQGFNTNVVFAYNSHDVAPASSSVAINGAVGANWHLGLANLAPSGAIKSFGGVSLDPLAASGSTVTLRDEDGTPHVFTACASGGTDPCPNGAYTGKYSPEPGVFLRLRDWSAAGESSPGSMSSPSATPKFVATRPDRVSFYYAGYNAGNLPAEDGRLLAIKDRNGNVLTIKYECVGVHDVNRTVDVPGVTDCASYSSPPSGHTKRYRITKINDQGNRDVALAYFDENGGYFANRDGRLKSVTDHAGVRNDVYYDRASSTVSNPAPRLAAIFEGASDGAAWTASTAYTAGQCVSKATPDGATHYRVTTSGTSHASTEPTWPTTVGASVTNNTVVFTLTASDDCIANKVAPWIPSTAYVVGQCVAKTSPDGNYFKVTSAGTTDSSEPAWPTSVSGTVTDGPQFTLVGGDTCRPARATSYQYVSSDDSATSVEDESMRIERVVDPRSNSTYFRYETTDDEMLPRVVRLIDRADSQSAFGGATKFEYGTTTNALNGTTSVLDELNSVTTYMWDTATDKTRGRVKRVVDANGVIKRVDWNSSNLPTARNEIAKWADNTEVMTGTTPQNLPEAPIDTTQNIEVRSAASGGGTLYAIGTDYTLDVPNGTITRVGTGSITSGQTVYVTYIHATWIAAYDTKLGLVTSQTDPGESATTTTYTNSSLDGYVGDVDLITSPRGTATGGDADDFQTNYNYDGSYRVTSVTSPINAGSGSGSDITTRSYTYNSDGTLKTETDANGFATGYSGYTAAGLAGAVHYKCTALTGTCTAVTSGSFNAGTTPTSSSFVYNARGESTCVDDRRESSSDTQTACVSAANDKVYSETMRDVFGQVVQSTSPWDGTKRRASLVAYDSNGNPVRSKSFIGYTPGTTTPTAPDSATKGSSAWTTYDQNNRPVSTQLPPNYGGFRPTDEYTVGECIANPDVDSKDAYRVTTAASASDDTEPTWPTTEEGSVVSDWDGDSYGGGVTFRKTATCKRIQTVTYDPADKVTNSTDPEGNSTHTADDYASRMSYDAGGRVVGQLDGEGRLVCHFYDAYNNETATSLPLAMDAGDTNCPSTSSGLDNTAYKVSRTYDVNHNVLSATNQRGKTTSYQYDSDGSVTQVTSPGGAVTTSTYTADGAKKSVQMQSMYVCTDGSSISQSSCSGTTTTSPTQAYTYDGEGRALTVVDPRSAESGDSTKYKTSLSYDAYGRLNRTELPRESGNSTTLYTNVDFDAMGRTTGASLQTTASSYGSVAASEKTTFAYQHDGGQTSKTDLPNDKSVSYTYDVTGAVASRTESSRTINYTYYADGSLKSDTKEKAGAQAWTATMRYKAGECVTRKIPNSIYYLVTDGGVSSPDEPTWPTTDGASVTDDTVTFTKGDCHTTYRYDLAGRPKTVGTDPGNTKTYSKRDKSGLPLQIVGHDGFTTNYAYNRDGLVTSQKTNQIETIHAYGDSGALTDVRTQSKILAPNGTELALANFTYNDDGRLLEVKRKGTSTTFTTTYSYDTGGNLTGISTINIADSKNYQNSQFTRDAGGNIRLKHEFVRVQTNDLRIWAVSTSYSLGDIVRSVTDNGRLYEVIDAGTSDTSEPTWPTTVNGTVTDGTGNLTFKEFTQVSTFTYDGQNRVLTDDLPGDSGDNLDGQDKRKYYYDSMGRIDKVEDTQCSTAMNFDDYSYESSSNNVNQLTTVVNKTISRNTGTNVCTASPTRTDTYTYGDDSTGKPTGSVVKIDKSAGTDIEYAYNKIGQRIGSTVGSTTLRTAYDPAGNRAADIVNDQALTYIYQGDDPRVWGEDDAGTKPYDSRGQLYDPEGRLIAELKDTTTRLILTDELGSVVSSFAKDGLVKTTINHETFGKRSGKLNTDNGELEDTDYQYTGSRQEDSTQTTHLQSRDLSTENRHFTTTDQYLDPGADLALSTNPHTLGRTAYASNNPVNLTDPDGHCAGNPFTGKLCDLGANGVFGTTGFGDSLNTGCQGGFSCNTSSQNYLTSGATPQQAAEIRGNITLYGGPFKQQTMYVGGFGRVIEPVYIPGKGFVSGEQAKIIKATVTKRVAKYPSACRPDSSGYVAVCFKNAVNSGTNSAKHKTKGGSVIGLCGSGSFMAGFGGGASGCFHLGFSGKIDPRTWDLDAGGSVTGSYYLGAGIYLGGGVTGTATTGTGNVRALSGINDGAAVGVGAFGGVSASGSNGEACGNETWTGSGSLRGALGYMGAYERSATGAIGIDDRC